MTAEHGAVVEARDLSRTFGSGHTAVEAVKGASLAARSGELVAIVGPSGSGKTTLLAMLGGLLTPTSGEVIVGGVSLKGLSGGALARYRRESVGFVFQSYNLLPYLSARKNLLAIAAITGLPMREARTRADRLLDELGIADRARAHPAELSGGERQRVAIGRALMNDPAIILVDEPTANLDTARGQQVVEMLLAEVRQRAKTALMVTHDLRMAAYASRRLIIEDGVVREA